jgi:hypothetical protein
LNVCSEGLKRSSSVAVYFWLLYTTSLVPSYRTLKWVVLLTTVQPLFP